MFIQVYTFYYFCSFLLLFSIELINSARILAVFPVPSISHQVAFRPLTQELARRGHDVVILTPDPAFPRGQAPANITEIDFHDISYKMWTENFLKVFKNQYHDANALLILGLKTAHKIFELQMQSQEVRDLINRKSHFDLIFTEACVRPALAMSHIFKAPLIQISSLGAIVPNFQVIGAPSHLFYYPESPRRRIYELNLWEKMVGAFADMAYRIYIWSCEANENEIIKRIFGPETPSIQELSEKVEMLFLNTNPVWDNNRPVPPSVIYLGGLHQKPEKELPIELKSYLDKSKHGVIYMSFGTNICSSQLRPEIIQIFTHVFSKLPYEVLWKWDDDELANRPKNVRISKWFPQSDVLRHPKIKLFITQAGLQSTDESITAGVPLIAFPMMADQWFNAEKYVQHEIGMKLNINTVTTDGLTVAINNVINNARYRQNIKQLGMLMRDRPQSSLERAVWWTEFVIRHGGAKHLRCATANVSWTEYLMLDVLAVVLGSLLIVSVVVAMILSYVYKKNVMFLLKKMKKD